MQTELKKCLGINIFFVEKSPTFMPGIFFIRCSGASVSTEAPRFFKQMAEKRACTDSLLSIHKFFLSAIMIMAQISWY